jgi:hypothetical protein
MSVELLTDRYSKQMAGVLGSSGLRCARPKHLNLLRGGVLATDRPNFIHLPGLRDWLIFSVILAT